MEEKKRKSNKKLTMLIVALILAALCTFGYFACQKIKKNDAKEKFVNAIDKLFTEVKNEEIKEEIKTLSGDYTITMNVSSRFIDQQIQDIVNKLKLNFKLDLDKENNKFNLNLNTTYDNDKLLNGKINIQDNNIYVFLTDIYTKWIKVDATTTVTTTNINTDTLLTEEDYKVLATEIKNALNSSFKKNYFTQTTENDLNKYTLTIDKNNALAIVNDVLTYLENSKDFIKVYEKVSTTKFSDEVKKAKAETKQYTEIDPMLISLYTDTNDDLKQVAVETTTNDETVKLVMELVNNKNIKITIYNNDTAMISGSIEETNENNKKTINLQVSMMGMFTAKLKVESNTKYNESVNIPTITDSIESDEITEEESETIITNLLNNKGFVKIMEAIENYMNKEEI